MGSHREGLIGRPIIRWRLFTSLRFAGKGQVSFGVDFTRRVNSSAGVTPNFNFFSWFSFKMD